MRKITFGMKEPNENSTAPTWVLISVSLGFVMATLDVTIINVALAEIQRKLSFEVNNLAWVVDGYTLTFASLLLAGGTLGVRLGAKQAYLIGLTVFLFGSLVCGLSTNSYTLIGSRMLQGLGAALFMPSSMTLLILAYPNQDQRVKCIALWAAIVSIASGLGPFIGGVLTQTLGWRSLFFINLPIGVAGILLTTWAVSPTKPKQISLRILSHFLAMIMFSSLCFILIEGPRENWINNNVLLAVVTSLTSCVLFFLNEKGQEDAIIPVEFFRKNGMLALNIMGFFMNFATFGIIFLLSLYFQQGYSLSPLEAGVQLLPMMAVFAIANLLAGKLAGYYGHVSILRYSSFLSIVSVVPLIIIYPSDIDLLSLTACISLTNLGMGISVPMMMALIMERAGYERASIASAILNANRQLGALFGVAFFAMIIQSNSDWPSRLYFGICMLMLSHCVSFIFSNLLTNKNFKE